MPENNNNNNDTEVEPTQTDIFQQQKKTIDTLIDVFEKQQTVLPQQIIYAQTAQPEQKKTKNYILYIAIGIVAIYLLKKGKK